MISSTVKAGLSRQISCRVVTATTSRSRPVTSSQFGRRLLTTQTPKKPTQKGGSAKKTPTPTSSSSSSTANIPNEMANPADVTVEVTPEMKRSNYALAIVLIGFVGGVWYYSMTSVGNQDSSGGNSDDPLAQLKLEAQEALERQEKELAPDEKAKRLMEEFSRGDHDPDKAEIDALEELEKLDEEEEAKKKKKKSWWKFW